MKKDYIHPILDKIIVESIDIVTTSYEDKTDGVVKSVLYDENGVWVPYKE